MPAKHKKDLYIAKSVHDLNLKTQVDTDKNTKVKIYCKSADKMFREAAKADSNQDEERAYVLFMKFTSLVQYICKTKEYKADKQFYDSLGGIKNVLTAVNKAEILQKSLMKRYEDLKEEAEIKAKLESDEKKYQEDIDKPRDNSINGDTLSKDAVHAKGITHTPEYGQDGGMTADQLYRLLQDDTKTILVMDARSSQQYQSSHMQYSQVVSVPQEAIKPGTTVTSIAKGLSSECKTMWDRRGCADCIVILDWYSTVRDLTKGSPLTCLKDAIYKWDSTVTLKTEPLVLDGGYESWLLRYPMFTTNPHVTRPPSKNDTSTSLSLLDFDYPSLEDDRPKPEPEAPVHNVPEMKPPLPDDISEQKNAPSISGNNAAISAVTSVINSAKSVPAVNRSSKPKQVQESSTPKTIAPSSSASSHGSSAHSGDVSSSSRGIAAKISSSSASEPSTNSPASNSNLNVPSDPSIESSKAKPVIPNRSLKPSVPDSKSLQNTNEENGNAEKSVAGNSPKTEGEMGTQGQTSQSRNIDVRDGKNDEGAEEITRMQKEHQIQEQQARQELEKMRQDKMRTENKQLRLEKAQIEKQLEEKIEALKRMQQELEAPKCHLEQEEAAQDEEQQQHLQKEETIKKQETGADTNAQTTPKSSQQEVKPPARVETKPVPRARAQPVPDDSVSQASAGQEPQSTGESDVQGPPQAEAKKQVQPSGQHQQHVPSTPATAQISVTSQPTSTTTLPAGWEKKLHIANNMYYYIDHNTETTHWNPPVIGPGGAATTATVSATKPVATTSSAQGPEAKGAVPRSPARQTTPSPSTTKTRLKSESSGAPQSGLKRSFSSPNIAQMVINEQDAPTVPTVNRASKPIIQRMPSSMIQSPQPNKSLSITRARNLNPVYGNQGRSLTGLRNLGNTCFMNSVVQCLSSTVALTHYFITDKYVPDINRQNPLGRGGNVAQEFAIVIKALWSGQYRSISPLDLRDTVTKYVPEFRKNIGHHHDSQEFLLFLLDGLHEDLNQVKKREYLKEEELEKYPDHTAAEISWTYHQRLNQSIIVTLFQGQFKSTICCLTCGHKSVKFEAFMYLSLPIPSSSRCTLQQCLQKFSTEEKLTGDNAIYCSRCKTNRDSAKVILIWKLPRILLIHLKRFYYEGMWRQKLQTMVDFPLVNMDMSPYTRGPKPGKPYHLYAVSNHIGTLDGGHYTACCINVNNSRWYKFDDHEVHEASQSNMKSSAAYILFYTTIDQFVP